VFDGGEVLLGCDDDNNSRFDFVTGFSTTCGSTIVFATTPRSGSSHGLIALEHAPRLATTSSSRGDEVVATRAP
jgi:hypothetical protein